MPGLVEDNNVMESLSVDEVSVEEARQSRLQELGEEWGIATTRPPTTPLPRPEVASIRTESDEFQAEELLKRQRLSESQGHPPKSGLHRAFTTTKKKTWEYKEIYNALVVHIASQGSPGVAEALIAKLNLVGGNLNLAQKSRTSLITRRKSLDLAERSQVLQQAVENRQKDMVEVLLPYADTLSLDTSLPIAVRNQDVGIVELLVRYGAGAGQTPDGQDAFRQACAAGGQADLVAVVLSSDGRPPVPCVSQCLVDAARAGCIDTVLALSQSIADGDHDNAAALKAAVLLGRTDIALALVLGTKPPAQPGLNEAFEQLMMHENINPNDKMGMAEILLCAGAEGDFVAQALIQASGKYFIEMVHLLVSYGASIEYQEAFALRKAVSKGKIDLVEIMLDGPSALSPAHASACVELVPKKMRFEERYAFLNLLLRKGANGTALDEALVDATEAGDVESARLLINPLFPGGKLVGNQSAKAGPRKKVFEQHATASTNHKGALALQIAVKNGNVPISKLILSNPPSQEAMAQIFPSVRNLPRLERFQVMEAFLGAGLEGPCVHAALQNVINDSPPHRDERLIALLLRSNADVNFNEGAGITAAIAQKDLSLLNRLLKSKPTPEVTAKALLRALEVENAEKRARMVSMLLGTGAVRGRPEISLALLNLLQTRPVDKPLLRALLEHGQADVNMNGGAAIAYAVTDTDPEVLELVLALGNPSPECLEHATRGLSLAGPSAAKADKLDALLRRHSSPETLDRLFIEEVQIMVKTPAEERNLSVLKTLLAHGADINANNAEGLCRAIAASNSHIVDLIFGGQPRPKSLAFAMPHALRIQDVMDRLTFAKKILHGGIPPTEVNRALVFAVSTYPDDIPLINTLLAHADTKDGLALMEAIKNEKQDIVELMLSKKKFAPEILNSGFTVATKGKNRRQRSISCSSLLKAGASGDVVSDALLAAASDGDVDFGSILVQNGGSIDHRDGQAVVEACRSGAVGVLAMLLSGEATVTLQTLERGFQAATELGDLAKRGDIFKLLLQRGISGEVVDAQLVSAGRYGDRGTDLVRLLLVYGANPDYKNGEAVEKAARSAFLANLEMLLGVVDVGGRQKKPASPTLVRALDASWDLSRDTRFTVMTWLFQAGRPVPSAVHDALVRVVNEEDPEERLIELLVANRASPTANGCQALVDGVRTLSASQFSKLLESHVSPEEASLVFAGAFGPENTADWFTERGLGIARCLLRKGAGGDGVGTAFTLVLDRHTQAPGDLADRFTELLLKYGADINHDHGVVLQTVAAQGNAVLLRRLLQQKPSGASLTLAFPRIFDANISEDEVHELITLFTEYSDGPNLVDATFVYPGSEPILIRALSQFPRSSRILKALLDFGYYHEPMTTYRVMEAVEEDEQVTLLAWALLQPQKKISSDIIKLLIDMGAKANFETRISRVTPLMLAIQSRRQDIVKALLLAGAEVDITDAAGQSPLSMASAVGGDLAITMMSNLLAAGASRNDGSLHNAARELNLAAMQILIEYRHDPDFPSPQHGGRSALGELCLHAADSGPIRGPREKAMERAMELLIPLSDVAVQSDGKSVLLLALESADALTTTRVLLRADMWKYLNKPFNFYTDGQYTYSPTQYAARVLPQSDTTAELLKLLKANRGVDVYYAHAGEQPEDATGMPSYVELEAQERRQRQQRLAKEQEDHARALQRSRELAAVQAQIWASQAELEDARQQRTHDAGLAALRARAAVEEDLFAQQLARQRAGRTADLAHQRALTDAALAHAQTVGDAALAHETRRQQHALAFERDLGGERVGHAAQLGSLRVREREQLEGLDRAADARFQDRLREQKRLVESQTQLAANLGAAGPGARRQIGFVSGELD